MCPPLGGIGCVQAREEMVSLLTDRVQIGLLNKAREFALTGLGQLLPPACLKLGASFPLGEACLSSVQGVAVRRIPTKGLRVPSVTQVGPTSQISYPHSSRQMLTQFWAGFASVLCVVGHTYTSLVFASSLLWDFLESELFLCSFSLSLRRLLEGGSGSKSRLAEWLVDGHGFGLEWPGFSSYSFS